MSDNTTNLERIELFPAGAEPEGRLPEQIGKWVARHIGRDGRILSESPGDFDHDKALQQAQQMWPGLEVYELNREIDDSTWDGVGPSPRLWQQVSAPETPLSADQFFKPELPLAGEQSVTALNVITVTGTYVRLDDIIAVLEDYASQFDAQNNPSAAMGLREAASALREPF